MPGPACSDRDFIELFQKHGASGTARHLGIDVRAVYGRRARLEAKLGTQIASPNPHNTRLAEPAPHRIELDIENGIVPVFSDAHYWPGLVSTAHRAFVRFCKEFAPSIRAVVNNGDALDGASISRHPPIGWETRPSLIQELEACQERLGEIEQAAPKARRVWNLGNHDARFETRLATVAPEYAKIHGVHLKDHLPHWEPAWSTWINDEVVIKHRFRGGIHATHNNTINAGKTMVTGHDHSGKVTPFSDYNGTRWGVSCPTLADPYGPQFVDYTEDNPRNHRSGFVVLTFYRGRLLWPEIAHVIGPDHVEFRGRVWEV